jgi:hypothetical protein
LESSKSLKEGREVRRKKEGRMEGRILILFLLLLLFEFWGLNPGH